MHGPEVDSTSRATKVKAKAKAPEGRVKKRKIGQGTCWPPDDEVYEDGEINYQVFNFHLDTLCILQTL